MRFFTARRLALAAAIPALLLFSVIPGCAEQGEGERCGDPTGASDNSDCGDGLTCTPSSELLNGSTDQANRCCYDKDRTPTDSRCTRSGTGALPVSTGGGSGSGAGAGNVSNPDAGVAGGSADAAGSGGV